MKRLVIEATKESDLDTLLGLSHKLGLNARIEMDDDIEDQALLELMIEEKDSPLLSEEEEIEFLKSLRS